MDDLARRVAELERRVALLEGARAPRVPVAPPIESRLGLTWLNRVGAMIVIAGLALAAVWAHERGYLAPPLRNLLGALVGLALFAVGARSLRSEDPARRAFGVGVAAVGAFALYLVPFAAASLDRLIDPAVAAAIAIAITVALAAFAIRRREALFALFAACFGAAFALATGHGVALFPLGAIAVCAALIAGVESLFLVGALLICGAVALALGASAVPPAAAIGAAGIAELAALRRWRHALATSLALVLVAFVGAQWRSLFGAPFDAAQGATLACALVALRAPSRGALDPANREDSLRLIAYVQAHVIALTLVLRAIPWDVARSIALVAHAFALTAVGVARRHLASRAMGLILYGAALVKAFVVDVWRHDPGVRVVAMLALGAGLLGGSYLYSRLQRRYAR